MNMADQVNADDVSRTLGIGRDAKHRGWLNRWTVAGMLVVLTVVAAMSLNFYGSPQAFQYRMTTVEQGALSVTITATGTLEPTNTVEIGSEISGQVESVLADYNDRVVKGQILARLDTEQLEARVVQSEASLESADASLQQMTVNVLEARRQLARAENLLQDQLVSQETLESAQTALARAGAQELSAKAQVKLMRANLDVDKSNLSKATIRSPINGIVLSRDVEPGQTVAASLQTPVLFTLAEDLTQMDLHVDIDEADVGQVKEGQPAEFTVDAYPDRRFSSQILSVYNAPQTVQDVVTYEGVLSVDNAALLLKPGMTATAEITVHRVENAVLIPNSALRFTPSILTEEQMQNAAGQSADVQKTQVWELHDGKPVPIAITTGLSDGRTTEVVQGDVEPGQQLLIAMSAQEEDRGFSLPLPGFGGGRR